MTSEEIENGNKMIAEFMGWELIREYPPNNVYKKGNKLITSISFHKRKLFDILLDMVGYLEHQYDLYIIIKRKECTIKEMHLTSDRTLFNIEGKTKQEAIWFAVVYFINWHNKIKT